MDPEAAIVLVQMSKSPSIIRFRSPTRGARVRFDVLLGRQKLGVFFTGNGVHDIPVVTRISSNQGFSSDSSASPLGARLGDVLVAVNGKDTIPKGLSMTMKRLETSLRPVRLTFERAANDHNTDGLFSSQTASEGTKETRRGSLALRNVFPNVTISGFTRETASSRCREFMRSLVPAGVHSTQPRLQGAGKRTDSHGASRDILIKWKSGPLGLTLVEDVISGVPVVNRLTGKGSTANMEHIQHGFQLYSINGEPSEGYVLDDLCQDLLTLPKPVELVFRPPQSDRTSEEDNNSEHTSLIRHQYEYEVVWTATQLGLQLEIPHTSEQQSADKTRRQYPIVHKVLKETTLDLPNDAVGHLFISINNWSTAGLSTIELRTLLRLATRPAVLRFRRPEAYSILWSEGKLGITFGCYDDADHHNKMVIYVKHIGPGQALNSKLVAIGDILRSINGQDLPPKQKFKKTMRSLVNTRQPVTLGFRRLLVERCSNWNT
ncbi:hypothetical protein PHMEG_00018235 [Phytophthora megakarya]|uniref:PDZ domain-containing protein n=1 Tax=Phytophthora megakarya TaxID=4795 RepID=A0A225VUI1_9STRA|nr:hypothetical protein PHMEG_00018235 [Phytophthora megakarya]